MKHLPTVALVLMAVAIAIPGLLGLFAPGASSGGPAGSIVTVDALNEARAVGGTRLAFGVVLALAALSNPRRRAGLAAGCVVFTGTLLGRLSSNAFDGAPGAMMKPEIAEVVLIAIAVAALTRDPPRGPPHPATGSRHARGRVDTD